MGKPVAEEIGHCASVSVREIGSTNVVVFEQEPSKASVRAVFHISTRILALRDYQLTCV